MTTTLDFSAMREKVLVAISDATAYRIEYQRFLDLAMMACDELANAYQDAAWALKGNKPATKEARLLFLREAEMYRNEAARIRGLIQELEK